MKIAKILTADKVLTLPLTMQKERLDGVGKPASSEKACQD